MLSGNLKRMALKKSIKNFKNTHRECVHCRVIDNEFLSNEGMPILGECEFFKFRFLLNELTDCEKWKLQV